MVSNQKHLDNLFDSLLCQEKLRVWSMVITIFGDAIVPRSGVITLGSLQKILERLKIEPNALRTALSRLAKDGWIERIKHGRQSSYALAKDGEQLFSTATQRIYSGLKQEWSGEFDMAMILPEAKNKFAEIDLTLKGDGYGSPLTGLYMKPRIDNAFSTLPEGTLRICAGKMDQRTPRQLAMMAWPVKELANDYQAFIQRYKQIRDATQNGSVGNDLDCLAIRILLIHDWRRIRLRDPKLPSDLNPKNWEGDLAFETVREIYHALLPASERALDGLESAPDMKLKASSKLVQERFKL